ncbi:MAG: UDP-N-acetylmuramoyl-L-alanyl-D-glutamate--2,6-diaminopimelate ligase [Pseudomonadota bacterium]
MQLNQLTKHLRIIDQDLRQDPNLNITGISLDSRKVRPGDLFIAMPSTSDGPDGMHFVAQAIAQGAIAVLGAASKCSKNICYLTSPDIQADLATLLPLFYSNKPESIVAVTGTNGKTSVVQFTKQMWAMLGIKAASIGTLGIDAYPDLKTLTSPDPITMHELLQHLAHDQVTHVALEASSHGLEQRRLAALPLKAAAFTNLSHDHLDYHETFADYFRAKQRLFSEVLQPNGIAVLNKDAPEFETLQALCQTRRQTVLSYGREGADLRIVQQQAFLEGQQLELNLCGERFDVLLPLVGDFQAVNALCALGLVISCEAGVKDAVATLSQLKPVVGRLQWVTTLPTGAQVFVDYAHTPVALEVALRALRQYTLGMLIVVFGCGGERDQQKRPIMGRVAAEFADQVFITDDNPRSESPEAIRAEIMQGCPEADEIDDRGLAITAALEVASPGDVVLVAGKGHESTQIIAGQSLPFNDAEVVRHFVTA